VSLKKYRKKPEISQRFSSGNKIEVYVKEIAPKIYDAACEWDNFPPSKQDIAEYLELVVPRMKAATEKAKAQNN
jgi:hypothetical protein